MRKLWWGVRGLWRMITEDLRWMAKEAVKAGKPKGESG